MCESTGDGGRFTRIRGWNQCTRSHILELLRLAHEFLILYLPRLKLLLHLLEVEGESLADLPQIVILLRADLSLHTILLSFMLQEKL